MSKTSNTTSASSRRSHTARISLGLLLAAAAFAIPTLATSGSAEAACYNQRICRRSCSRIYRTRCSTSYRRTCRSYTRRTRYCRYSFGRRYCYTTSRPIVRCSSQPVRRCYSAPFNRCTRSCTYRTRCY
ncbi:MAG: hypothetical protein KC503_43320 [Myxococcales bacterium]|nr:hypothetical protein [Myxococcales bacterium]